MFKNAGYTTISSTSMRDMSLCIGLLVQVEPDVKLMQPCDRIEVLELRKMITWSQIYLQVYTGREIYV